jgi:hypothetical protein
MESCHWAHSAAASPTGLITETGYDNALQDVASAFLPRNGWKQKDRLLIVEDVERRIAVGEIDASDVELGPVA